MSCCDTINGGSPAIPFVPAEALCGTPICVDVTTTNAAVQTINIGTLNGRGDSLTFQIWLAGNVDGNGERGIYLFVSGNAAQNATGNGAVTAILQNVGYTDAVLIPWSTLGIPAGWASGIAFIGNVLALQFNASVGATVQWRGMILRWAHNGATLA